MLCACTVAAFAQGTPAWPSPKLSAGAKAYLWKLDNADSTGKGIFAENVYRMDAQQNVYVSGIIKIYPGFDAAALDAIGVKVGTKAGLVWTVQVPPSRMRDLAQVNGIEFIDTDSPVAPDLDTARRLTRVDSVHHGYLLPQPYSGKDVVMGVIDVGFDYTHPTFYDTAYSAYRIKRVWEEKNISGPSPANFAYGTEFTDSASILAQGQDRQDQTHGTHVAGIAAGSGNCGPNGSDDRYRGMAYESDIVMVGIYPTAASWMNTGMTDMLDGINYVFSYADSVSKPAVANLSWGCPLGPHDGNSLFSQACNSLVGPGKIFVLSAGNNGTNRIHIRKTFTPTDTTISTNATFPASITPKQNWIDAWGDTAQPFCIKFSLYMGTTLTAASPVYCLDDSTRMIHLIGQNNDTCFILLTTVASEFNQKPHMRMEVLSRVNDKLIITVTGNSGTVDMWQGLVVNSSGYYGGFLTGGFSWCTMGDLVMQISDMATTENAIAVGAYNSKPTFTNVSNQTLTYTGYTKGQIASFSSHGPTADGRTKPNITGPGMALASAVNSQDPSFWSSGSDYNAVVSVCTSPVNAADYSYAMLAGTSMSGPAVSGIVGLLLEADSSWNPQQMMGILAATAIRDSYVGSMSSTGSNTWGFGKVNCYGAMQEALNYSGIYHPQQSTLNCLVYPNPGTGYYSLSTISNTNETLQVDVMDISGRVVQAAAWNVTQGANTMQLDLTTLPAGTYFVRVNGSEGASTMKVVKG